MRFPISIESRCPQFKSQNIGIIQTVSLIFTACVLFFASHQIVTAQTVHMPDSNLRTVLKLALGKEMGDDITQADMASLESLEAPESGIRDLTGLEFAINLTKLDLGLNEIPNVAPLKNLTNLTELYLNRNRRISDVSPLKNLTNLRHLTLGGNLISDISPLKDLISLSYLHVGYNNVVDISPLKYLTTLTFLNLDDNRISDVSPLADLPNLTALHLDDNRISDMSPLNGLTTLTFLNINDNKISDLSPLTNLTNLTTVNLHGNGISDVSVLTNLTDLTILKLHENKISDISPLADLTNLTILRLHDNRISDISPLKGLITLTKLFLYNNEISDVSVLKDLINLKVLDLSDNHITDFSPIAGLIENLEKYDNSNQTGTPLNADVNHDGIVDTTDLILVALSYGNPNFGDAARSDVYPDVNRDGVVDVEDLISVAAEIDATAAAPALKKNPVATSPLTAASLTQWIQLAKQLDRQQPYMQKGITTLERLLTALTFTEVLSKETALLANYPNPFNPETWIPYQLAEPAAASISIYAGDGKLVRTLALGHLAAGAYRSKSRAAYWDGRNELGEPVASGVYFYTLTAGGFITTGKMILQK